MEDSNRAKLALIACLALQAGAGISQVPTCPSQGPVLFVSGGRLGDDWYLGLSGDPDAAAVVGIDVSPGPTQTPFGQVCLGLTGSMATLPASLDSTGSWSTGGLLPLSPSLSGTSMYLQAAVADPQLPFGVGITNGSAVRFRPPLVGAFQGVVPNPPALGGYVAVDAITDGIVAAIPLSMSGPVLRIPRLGWFAFRTAIDAVQFIDDFTGSVALTIPGALANSFYFTPQQQMAVSSDGSIFFAEQAGSGVSIAAYALPSGTLAGTAAIPIPGDIFPVPGTSLAYVQDVDRFRVFDGATAAIVATVVLPGPMLFGTWPFAAGSTLFVPTSAGLFAVDMTTHAIVAGPAPLPPAGFLAHGPGSSGPALFTTAIVGGVEQLLEYSPSTLTLQASTPLPGHVYSMSLSAGGGSWLMGLVPSGAAQLALVAFHPATHAFTPVLPSIQGAPLVVPSDTLTKAYALVTPTTLVAIPTDPVGSAGAPIPIPLAPGFTLLTN